MILINKCYFCGSFLILIVKIRFCLLIFCTALAFPAMAQSNFSFSDRLFFGGNIFFEAGDWRTDIDVSPIVGYYITPRLSAGTGITYRYLNYKLGQNPDGTWHRFETHIWGFRPFTNYVIINNVGEWIPIVGDFRIFAHFEYEALKYEKRVFPEGPWQHNILGGGGLRLPMGRRSSANIFLLWYIYSKPQNPYSTGLTWRVGFNF